MMEMPAVAARFRIEALPANRFRNVLRQSISAHAIFWAIIAAYYTGFVMLLRMRPELVPSSFLLIAVGFTLVSVPFMFLSVFFMRFYHIARHVKPERPIPALLKDIKQFLGSGARMANGIPMVIIMIIFMYVFVNVKADIPILNPFAWDKYFSDLDKTLHFGRQPWEWLQPLLGYAPITFLININYNFWFLTMWMVWVFFAFADGPSELRTRFFLSFFGVWILVGGVLAIVFSSAGPCFYSKLGLAPDPYTELMTYLRGVNEVMPVWAIPVQDLLWQGHIDESVIDGISAMPSMHNGSALLFALAGYQVSRLMGRILFIHAALIFIGSVHLGWHYAVDSYLAWALTLAIWFAMTPVSRWWHSKAAQGDFDRMLAAGA
jgi:hypothetical protein